MSKHTWENVPTQTVNVNGVTYAYRQLGTGDVPVIFLHHLMAVLDDWDPEIINGIATQHKVIAFDNKGVGSTEGVTPNSIDQMAIDAISFIQALGFNKVDLLGFSMGGGVAQSIALQAPDLVRRIVLAGTGPKGGGGIERINRVAISAYLKAVLTLSDPRNFLFFPRTKEGRRAAKAYLTRLKQRSFNRDKRISLQSRIAQLQAIKSAGLSQPDDLSKMTQPVFIANGDNDLMVDSSLSLDLANRIPNSKLSIYPDSGHGGVFQYYDTFLSETLAFLDNQNSTTSVK